MVTFCLFVDVSFGKTKMHYTANLFGADKRKMNTFRAFDFSSNIFNFSVC